MDNSALSLGNESHIFPDRNSLRVEYDKHLHARTVAARELEVCIEKALLPLSSNPHVKGRVKSFESFFKKYVRLLKASGNSGGSLPQIPPHITDLIGIRVICPFLEDLPVVQELIKEKFHVVEVERKGGDHTFREFGYESIHLLITIPQDIVEKAEMYTLKSGDTAEIQIRTILQDAWAEVEHEFVYKAEFIPFDNPLKRKLAAVNASLSLADVIFQEIRSYQRVLNNELEKRRNTFFRKIEESTDDILFPTDKDGESAALSSPKAKLAVFQSYWDSAGESGSISIDDLLVEALSAHNENHFPQAIAIYTKILDMKPDDSVRSLILKHRGMAFFARSNYTEAIEDFSLALELDPKSYKAAYYQGIACSVLQRYSHAVDAYCQSLDINPYQPYCLFRRGQAYYHLGDFPQALGDCEAALALEPFEAAKKFRDLVLTKLKM